MKISVNIKVRNPEWYESIEEIKKSKSESICIEEWIAFNEYKIGKHTTFVDFEYSFVVNSYIVNKKGMFRLSVSNCDNVINNNPKKQIFLLDNVSVIEFIGNNNKGYVVVSNELIHEYWSEQKNAESCQYFYFYLKENTDHNKLTENIWLSDEKILNIEKQFGDYAIEKDSNLIIRKEGGFNLI